MFGLRMHDELVGVDVAVPGELGLDASHAEQTTTRYPNDWSSRTSAQTDFVTRAVADQ